MFHRSTNSRRRRLGDRRGMTTVELALVSPLLFSFFFASIEFARANQIMNATANAAYQGCRAAIIPGATATTINNAVQKMLAAGLITGQTVTINPSAITNATSTVTVTITVPMNSNTWLGQVYMNNKTVVRSCTLTREKTN
jgi:Flp pilus assembly protein TadG